MDVVTEQVSPFNSTAEDVLADLFNTSDESTSSDEDVDEDQSVTFVKEGEDGEGGPWIEDLFEADRSDDDGEREKTLEPMFPQVIIDPDSLTKPNIRYHNESMVEIFYGDRKGTVEVLRVKNGIEIDHNANQRLYFSCVDDSEDDDVSAVDFLDEDHFLLYGTFSGKLDLVRMSLHTLKKAYSRKHIYQTPHKDPIICAGINRIDSGFVCASYYDSHDKKEELVILDLSRQLNIEKPSTLVKYHFLEDIDALSWSWYDCGLLTVASGRSLRVIDLRCATAGPRTMYHEYYCKLLEPCKWRPELLAGACGTEKNRTDTICLFDVRKLAVPLYAYEVDDDVARHGIDIIRWHPHDPYELMYSSRGAHYIGKLNTEICNPFSRTSRKIQNTGKHTTVSLEDIWDFGSMEEQYRYQLERNRNAFFPLTPEPIELLDYTKQIEAAAVSEQIEMPLMVRSPRFPLSFSRDENVHWEHTDGDIVSGYYDRHDFYNSGESHKEDEGQPSSRRHSMRSSTRSHGESKQEEAVSPAESVPLVSTETHSSVSPTSTLSEEVLDSDEAFEMSVEEMRKGGEKNKDKAVTEGGPLLRGSKSTEAFQKTKRLNSTKTNIFNYQYLTAAYNERIVEKDIVDTMLLELPRCIRIEQPRVTAEVEIELDEEMEPVPFDEQLAEKGVGFWCPKRILERMKVPEEMKAEALEFFYSVLPENTVIAYESVQTLARVVRCYLEQEYLGRSDYKKYYDEHNDDEGLFGYQSEEAILSFAYPPKRLDGVIYLCNGDYGKIQYVPPAVQPTENFLPSKFMRTMERVKAFDLYANIPFEVWKQYYKKLARWQKAAMKFGYIDLIRGLFGAKWDEESTELLEDCSWLFWIHGSVCHYEGKIKNDFLKGVYIEYKSMLRDKRRRRKIVENKAIALSEAMKVDVINKPPVTDFKFLLSPRSSECRIELFEGYHAKEKELSLDPMSTIGASHFLTSLIDDDEKDVAINDDESGIHIILGTPELRSIASTKSMKSVATTVGTTPHGTPQDKKSSLVMVEKRRSITNTDGEGEDVSSVRKRSRPIPILGADGAPRKYSANWSGKTTYEEDTNSFKWLFGDSANPYTSTRDLRTPSGRSPRTVAEEKAARKKDKDEKKSSHEKKAHAKQEKDLQNLRSYVSGTTDSSFVGSDEPLGDLKPEELRRMAMESDEEKTPTKSADQENDESLTPIPPPSCEKEAAIPEEIVPVWEVIKSMEKGMREARRSREEEEQGKEKPVEKPTTPRKNRNLSKQKGVSTKTEDFVTEDGYIPNPVQETILDILTTVSAEEDRKEHEWSVLPIDDEPDIRREWTDRDYEMEEEEPVGGRQKKLSAVLEEDHSADDLSPKPTAEISLATRRRLRRSEECKETIHIKPPQVSRERRKTNEDSAFFAIQPILKKSLSEPGVRSKSSIEREEQPEVIEEEDLKPGSDVGSAEISPRDKEKSDMPVIEPLNLKELQNDPGSSGMNSEERLATHPENPLPLVQDAAIDADELDDEDSEGYMWVEYNPNSKTIILDTTDSDGDFRPRRLCTYADIMAYLHKHKRKKYKRVRKKRKSAEYKKIEVPLKDVERIKDAEPQETYFEFLVREEEKKMIREERRKKKREEKLKSTTTAGSSLSSIPNALKGKKEAPVGAKRKPTMESPKEPQRKSSDPLVEFRNKLKARKKKEKMRAKLRRPVFFYGLPGNDAFHTIRIQKDDFDLQMKGFPGMLQLIQCEIDDEDEELHYLPFDTSLVFHLKFYTSFYRERMLKSIRLAHEDTKQWRLKITSRRTPEEYEYYEKMLILLLQGKVQQFLELSEDVYSYLDRYEFEDDDSNEFADQFLSLCKEFVEFIFNYRNNPETCSMHRYDFENKIEEMISFLHEYLDENQCLYPILMIMKQEVMEDHQPHDFAENIEIPLHIRLLFYIRVCETDKLEKCLLQEFIDAERLNRLIFVGMGNHYDSLAVLSDYLDETNDFQTVAHICLSSRTFEEEDHYFEMLHSLLTATDPEMDKPILIDPEYRSAEMPEELFQWPDPPERLNIADFNNYDVEDENHPMNKLVKLWKKEVPGGAARIFAWMHKNGRLPPHHDLEEIFPRRFIAGTQSKEVYMQICREATLRYFTYLNIMDSMAIFGMLEEITTIGFKEYTVDSPGLLRFYLIQLSGNKNFRPLTYPKMKVLPSCQFCGMTRMQGKIIMKKNEELEKKELLSEAKMTGKRIDPNLRRKVVADPDDIVSVDPDDEFGAMYSLDSEVNRIPDAACPNCRRPMGRCAVCHYHDKMEWNVYPRKIIERQMCVCVRCHHGGHAIHMIEWFRHDRQCPIPDCKCECDREGMYKLFAEHILSKVDFSVVKRAPAVYSDCCA